MKEKLLDSWGINGTDLATFKNELNSLSNVTSVKKVLAKNVTIYSKNEFAAKSTTEVPVFVLRPDKIWHLNEIGEVSLIRGRLNRAIFTKANALDVLEEYENSTKRLFGIDNAIYLSSQNLSPTLGLRTEMKGESVAVPTLERDILTAKRLNTEDEISFIVRNYDGVKKIFAALSGTYAYEPQNLLCKIIERVEKESKLGKIECRNWSINNQVAEIYLEFPETAKEIATVYGMKDNLTPGLYLAKSDVGECSITIRSTWRINSSVIITDEIKRKHSGKIDIEAILEDVDELVYSKYTKLPDTLCELMNIDITDPAWAKVMSEKKFLRKNNEAVCEAIKNVFDGINLVGAICKKNEKTLYELLCNEIDPAFSYTAYDIAILVMQLPTRMSGLADVYKENLAKACGKAPYVFGKTKAKTSKVVLTS